MTIDAAPPVPPVTRAELRAHLRLSEGFPGDGAEDALIDRYLAAATAEIERATAQFLIRRAVVLRVACWDAAGHLILPVGPVTAIDSLTIEGTSLDAAALAVEPGATRQRVTGPGGAPLAPIPAGRTTEIGFAAGHGDTGAEVPEALSLAVMMLAAERFERRAGAGERGLPAGIAALIGPHRPVRL